MEKSNDRRTKDYSTLEKIIKTIFLVLVWAMIGLYTEISGTTQKDLILITRSNYELVSRAVSGRSAGYFIGSLIGGPLVDKLEKYCDLMIAICLDLAAVVTVIAPYSSNVSMLGVLLILGGTFEGVINIAGQKLILNLWGDKATGPLHILHFGFGMGSFIVPQIANPFLAVLAPLSDINTNITTSDINTNVTTEQPVSTQTLNMSSMDVDLYLKESRIESAYLIVSIIVATLSVVFYVYQFCCGKIYYSNINKKKTHESNIRKITKIVDPITCAHGDRWFGIKIFALLFLYFFNAVGGERLFSKFIRSYAIDKHNFTGDEGSLINTAFWICFAIGRLTGLFTGRFVPIRILILVEVSGALVTSILMEIFARDNALALWILTCPMGFFISPLFPSGIGWGDFHVEFTGFAITFVLMGGALGGVCYLWVIGYLYEYHGYDMFLHQLVFYGGMVVLFAIIMSVVGIRHGGRFHKNEDDAGDDDPETELNVEHDKQENNIL